jgi:hypothetical protein
MKLILFLAGIAALVTLTGGCEAGRGRQHTAAGAYEGYYQACGHGEFCDGRYPYGSSLAK